MKTNQSIVIIPTYNEKENIENIIRAVMALEDNFNILIIMDGRHLRRLPAPTLLTKDGEQITDKILIAQDTIRQTTDMQIGTLDLIHRLQGEHAIEFAVIAHNLRKRLLFTLIHQLADA